MVAIPTDLYLSRDKCTSAHKETRKPNMDSEIMEILRPPLSLAWKFPITTTSHFHEKELETQHNGPKDVSGSFSTSQHSFSERKERVGERNGMQWGGINAPQDL